MEEVKRSRCAAAALVSLTLARHLLCVSLILALSPACSRAAPACAHSLGHTLPTTAAPSPTRTVARYRRRPQVAAQRRCVAAPWWLFRWICGDAQRRRLLIDLSQEAAACTPARSLGAEVAAASGVDVGVAAYSSPCPVSPASSRIWWPPCIAMLRASTLGSCLSRHGRSPARPRTSPCRGTRSGGMARATA
jgi:hypothetical protein